MPELPEVETIVRGLNKKVKGKKIIGVWTDWPRHFSRHKGGFNSFKRQVTGVRIKNVNRLGKNIIFDLSTGVKMLVHLKMTGRLLFLAKSFYRTSDDRQLYDILKKDKFIHSIFYFSDGTALALSDVRKFGKITLLNTTPKKDISELLNLGPDALKITLTNLKNALTRRKSFIKKALLDQKVLAGIGNIYADEVLFIAGVYPFKSANILYENEIKKIHSAIKTILTKAIKLRGTSMSDYRDINGNLGNYYKVRLVYGREGEPCSRCKKKIARIKFGGRSTHFCGNCQI